MIAKVVEAELQEIDVKTKEPVMWMDEEDKKRKNTKEITMYRLEFEGDMPGSIRVPESETGSLRIGDKVEVTFGTRNVKKG